LKFTVHHTCSKEGGKYHVLKNAPFLSEYYPSKGKKPYLGEGYYFWEYNLDYAKVWGKQHYSNRYFVCEYNVDIDQDKEGYFLDLVGNRKHLVGFVNLLSEFNLIHEDGTKGIDLCYIINYLRKNFDEEVFPYKVIRAVDYHNRNLEAIKISFNEDRPSYTILNPRIIFSYKNISDIVHTTEPLIKFVS